MKKAFGIFAVLYALYLVFVFPAPWWILLGSSAIIGYISGTLAAWIENNKDTDTKQDDTCPECDGIGKTTLFGIVLQCSTCHGTGRVTG
jgi:hypothetical protein